MRPGITKRFPRSSASAAGGTAIPPARPTAAMRPSSTTTTASRTGGAPVPSKSVPQRIARTATSGPRGAVAVIASGGVGRDVPFGDVTSDGRRLALRRRAPAAATTAHDAHDLAGADRVLGRLAHVAHRAVGRGDLDVVHRALAPAVQAPRRRG